MATAPSQAPQPRPQRTCRLSRIPCYLPPPIPAIEFGESNPNYSHAFLQVGQSWRTVQLFSQDIREKYAQMIQNESFNEKTAKWFIWSTPNLETDKYVKYAVISSRILKPSWKHLTNHIIAVTLPFQVGSDWYVWLSKVKKRIEKLDGDFDNVELVKIRFENIHQFHGVAQMIHELVLEQWDYLSEELRSFLSARPRFGNDIMMRHLGLLPRKTVMLLQDGSIYLFQAISTGQYFWSTPQQDINKIGVLPIHHRKEAQNEKGKVDLDEWTHVCNRKSSWLRDYFYKTSQLMENRRYSWKMRFVSLCEIRQVANMMRRQELVQSKTSKQIGCAGIISSWEFKNC